jgi:hypothetical protein
MAGMQSFTIANDVREMENLACNTPGCAPEFRLSKEVKSAYGTEILNRPEAGI